MTIGSLALLLALAGQSPACDFPQLEHGISEARPSDVAVAFSCLHYLDGGDLEDALEALGNLTERHAPLLLRNFKRQDVSRRQITDVLLSVPDSVIDNTAARLALYQRRVEAIRRVNVRALEGVRQISLTVLTSGIAAVRAARNQAH